jgi:hypothetical protein
MDASERGAMMLVRFVAISLIGFSVAELTLTFALGTKTSVPAGAFVLRSLPAVAGIIILIRARPIARWIADLLDN